MALTQTVSSHFSTLARYKSPHRPLELRLKPVRCKFKTTVLWLREIHFFTLTQLNFVIFFIFRVGNSQHFIKIGLQYNNLVRHIRHR